MKVLIISALFLCSIAVITEGKYAVLECETLDRLVQLVEDSKSEVRLNAIKVLSLVAEAPKGKQQLIPALTKVYIQV